MSLTIFGGPSSGGSVDVVPVAPLVPEPPLDPVLTATAADALSANSAAALATAQILEARTKSTLAARVPIQATPQTRER
jgi:hypothetical protein